jgi:hypothetical protein
MSPLNESYIPKGVLSVRLASRTSLGKDNYPRPSLFSDRILQMRFLPKHIPLYNKSPDYDLHRHRSEKGRQFATISHYHEFKANTMGLLPIKQVDSPIIS